MKMSVVMMLIYGVTGVMAAVVPNKLLDPKLALVVLSLLYSAHISWGAVAGKRAHESSISNPE
jgi:hypothetical protein